MKLFRMDARERKALKQAFLRFLSIPIVLILLSSVLISYDDYLNRKRNIMYQQRDEIVSAMIDYRDYVSNMTSVARTVESSYIELSGREQRPEAYEDLFMQSLRQYPILDKLRILDLNGMEVLRVNRTDEGPAVVPKSELQDLSDCYYYQETTTLGRHQFLFSGLDLNREYGEIAIDPGTGLTKPVLHISSPLEPNGVRIGYFVADFGMREYLDALRTSLGRDGCTILLLDENGYLYNDADDANNFGFSYDPASAQHGRTIYQFYPDIDLTVDNGSFIRDREFCTYSSYRGIYEQSRDYFLPAAASARLIFLNCYNNLSAYANDLHYSYFYHLVVSWKTQLLVWVGLILLYVLMINLFFLYDRLRFTNLFSDNRYTKSTLRQAIKNHQFVNYYQPIINIQDGSLLGIEALSRWNDHGQVLPPSMFMDEVLHYQLGQLLDENAFMLVRADRKRMEQYPEFDDTFISINCCQQTFSSLIQEPPGTTIQLTEEEKKYIVLELLEDIVFNKNTQQRIQELYKHNIMFAIDDFGTGNSNVAFIRSFENLKVKIDRTFVPVDTTNRKERVIIEAFVKMFVDQGLKLIVEGVETREQIQYLKKLGIAGVQGFYFSHPMTIDQMIAFVEKKDYLQKL